VAKSSWTEGLKKAKDKIVKTGTRYNTDVENNLLYKAKDRFRLAETAKVDYDNEPYHTKWKRFDQIYRGDHWFTQVPDNKSMPSMNFTRALIDSLIPRLTANEPETILMPRMSASDYELAQSLTGVTKHLWYINRMQEEQLGEGALIAMKYGTVFFKTFWDPEMWNDLGDVRYTVVHPMNFYPDPRATSIRGMEYCFVKVPKALEYFARRWPEKGKYVVADNDWTETESLKGGDRDSMEPRATLTEYWFRDTNGNVCLMYYAGDVVLAVLGGEFDSMKEYKNRPLYLHNRFPFSAIYDYKVDKRFWGVGEAEICETIQTLINEYEAQIIDNTRLMGNGQWVVNKVLSGLDETDAWIFDNEPGRVIFSHNGGVERIPGMPIPHHIPDHLEKLIFWMEQITGMYDLMQGRRPIGVRAASAIIALQEAASIRVQQKAREMAAGIREMVEQAIWIVLENYEEPRMVRLAGQVLPVSLDVRKALEARVVDMAKAADLLPQEAYAGGEEPQVDPAMMEQLMEEVKFPEFDVHIKVGPSVPYSQALLYEQSKEFFQLGIIDRQAVLEATNFPNKEEILNRLSMMEGQAQVEEERIGERTF